MFGSDGGDGKVSTHMYVETCERKSKRKEDGSEPIFHYLVPLGAFFLIYAACPLMRNRFLFCARGLFSRPVLIPASLLFVALGLYVF